MRVRKATLSWLTDQVNPVLSVRPGQVQRWRIVNASNARFYKLSLAGHTMYLIGTDGGLLDKAYALSHIFFLPAIPVRMCWSRPAPPTANYKFQVPVLLPHGHDEFGPDHPHDPWLV